MLTASFLPTVVLGVGLNLCRSLTRSSSPLTWYQSFFSGIKILEQPNGLAKYWGIIFGTATSLLLIIWVLGLIYGWWSLRDLAQGFKPFADCFTWIKENWAKRLKPFADCFSWIRKMLAKGLKPFADCLSWVRGMWAEGKKTSEKKDAKNEAAQARSGAATPAPTTAPTTPRTETPRPATTPPAAPRAQVGRANVQAQHANTSSIPGGGSSTPQVPRTHLPTRKNMISDRLAWCLSRLRGRSNTPTDDTEAGRVIEEGHRGARSIEIRERATGGAQNWRKEWSLCYCIFELFLDFLEFVYLRISLFRSKWTLLALKLGCVEILQ